MKLIAFAAVACIAISGCTQQSKDEYKAAGHDLVNAGKETGKAIKNDVDMASAKTKEKVDEAKKQHDEKKGK